MAMDLGDLKELNAIFQDMGGVDKVDEYTNQYTNLPDGTYIGEIEKIDTANSKKNGKPMLIISMAFEGGKKESKYMMLAGNDLEQTQTNVARAVTQLKKLGVEGVQLEDFINDAEEKLVGQRVMYKVETVTYMKNGEEKEFRNQDITLA